MSLRRLVLPVVGLLIVVAVVAGLVWFLSGDPDDDRNTSGFAPPKVTQASFCAGVAGFRADAAAVDPATDPAGYVAQLKTAADRLRSAGTPDDIPADAKAGLAAYLARIQALPDAATTADIRRLDRGATAADRKAREALDAYLAQECPTAGDERWRSSGG